MRVFLFLIVTYFLVSCNDEGGSTAENGGTNNNSSNQYSISLDFQRVPKSGLDDLKALVSISNEDGPISNISPSVSLQRGSMSEIENKGQGRYEFLITTSGSGEYKVTVSYGGKTVSRTPLVVKSVHSDWGVPMAVEGLVNTAGYEDGVTITPDGEYLFVQTSPQYHAGTFVMEAARSNGGCGGAMNRLSPSRCSHPWLDTIAGPYTAPERPGFFSARFSGDTILHNANSWGVGVDEAPNYAISTMFYGFKRQADGSFREPFYVAFNDENDGIQGPFGLSFHLNGDGTATTLFAWQDARLVDNIDLAGDGSLMISSLRDIYQVQITLGENNNLGDMNYSGTPGKSPVRGSYFPSKLVNFGDVGPFGIAGTQGNPHLHMINGSPASVWTDDEFDGASDIDYGDISVFYLDSGDLNNGSWSKIILPTNVNVDSNNSSHEIQPFFTGDGLYFTRSGVNNPNIMYSAYSGNHSKADLQNNANWTIAEMILEHEAVLEVGRIVGIGEPTLANYNGKEILYFVYAYIRSIDALPPVGTGALDLDFQAGFIEKVN